MSRKVIGYMAYFKLTNGFSKVLYRTKEDMLAHADRYSQAFSWKGERTNKYTKVSYEDYLLGKYNKEDEYLYSSFWYKDFDSMACGKVLKKLIQEYGVLSVDLQSALDKDDKIIESFEKGESGMLEINALEVDNTTKYDNLDKDKEIIEEDTNTALKGETKAQTSKKKKMEAPTVEVVANEDGEIDGFEDFFGN